MMKYLEFLGQLEDTIRTGRPVFAFFFREESVQCRMIANKLARLLKKHPEVSAFAVDLEKHPTAAGEFLAYTVPTVSIFVGGKPVLKRSEDIILPEIDAKLRAAAGV